MSAKIIVLTGIDGSGKTSHARQLMADYLKEGTKSKYIWMRTSYFFSFPFMVFCRVLGFSEIITLDNGHTHTEHQYFEKPIVNLWPWIQFLDAFLFFKAKTQRLSKNCPLIADRFIHDILVDLMVDTNNPHLFQNLPGKLMLNLVPKGSEVILFDIDEKVALKRKTDIPNLQYLTARRSYYNSIARYLRISTVNSDSSFVTVHDHLLQILNRNKSKYAEVRIEQQLTNRLQARARWKKWKKGPVALGRHFANHFVKILIDGLVVHKDQQKSEGSVNTAFPRQSCTNYIDMLTRRGLKVHTAIIVGSWAKGRGTERSDLDMIVIASGLPKGFLKTFLRKSKLSDFPLFQGIEPFGCTKEEFLRRIERLNLLALDAMYCGIILFDDGFWKHAIQFFGKIKNDYQLDDEKIKLKLNLI